MRTVIIMLAISIFSLGASAQEGKNHKVEIKTSAICEMCQFAIEKEMAYEKGVQTATLDLETKVLTVTYNAKKTDAEKIKKRVSLTGYHADNVKRDSVAYEKLPMCCKDGAHSDEE